MPPVVALRSVVALVDRFPVLADVDLDVAEGEIVLLQGPNGAGKTSLLRLLAGLLPVAQGEARVFDVDLDRDAKALRRRVGFLAHQSLLYGDLTAEENVTFFVRAGGGRVNAVKPALSRLRLDGRLATVPVDRLSAGQRRRVALAVLVARDPELWLLDEPHAGLDADSRAELDEIVRESSARNRTIVFTSHEGDDVKRLATRIVLIDGGVVDTRVVDVRDGKEPTYVS